MTEQHLANRQWNNLISALQHGRCILLLGPEIPATLLSPGAGGESQTEVALVEELKRKLAAELEAEGRLVRGNTLSAVAQQYEDAYKSNSLQSTAEEFYRSQQYGPSAVHKKLAELPFSLIVTTCQDDLLAQAYQGGPKTPDVQRYHSRGDKRANPEFPIQGTPAAPVIYHLFGNAGEPSSLVLSENDLLDFLIAVISGSSPLPNSLLSALKRKQQSFLFLGFGVRRWDLRILLKILLKTWGQQDQGTPIAAEPLRGLQDSEEMVLFYQRGMRLELEDTDVDTFLNEVSRRLQAAGGYAAQAAPLGKRPRVFISYAREDGDLASRLFVALQKAAFDPWFDRESLPGGSNWNQEIESELAAADFVLVLYTPAFCHKNLNYVNKEVDIAADRSKYARGTFLIPLRTFDIPEEQRVKALRPFDEMPLRSESFDQDVAQVIKTMMRAFQERDL